MNTTAAMDDTNSFQVENPGVQLSNIRQQKGYTLEYVASKLHLRVRIIEHIERGEFNLLPEPVFIRGYLRAYAKLLSVSPEPFLQVFNSQFIEEKKPERALWQNRRESHKAEHFIRWFTVVFAVGVMVSVGLWWHSNRDNQTIYSAEASAKDSDNDLSLNQIPTTEIKLTDVTKVESLLNPNPQMSRMEKQRG
jgi:cytoskeletal protein RodZ